jgi:hypothetical protein
MPLINEERNTIPRLLLGLLPIPKRL